MSASVKQTENIEFQVVWRNPGQRILKKKTHKGNCFKEEQVVNYLKCH